MDTARLWVLRVNEPDFSGWDAFAEWLEADPANLAAYEAALADDEWARRLAATARGRDALSAARPAPAAPPRDHQWRRALGGALAATLAAVVLWFAIPGGDGLTQVATGPGEQREIALADGSRITVNGNSKISYDPQAPRHVTLAAGEVLFEIEHDEANPFVVMAGDTRLVDAGTVFNVTTDGGAIDVAVAEGAVIYQANGEDITLRPGDRLARLSRDGGAQVSRADTAAVGSWREGVLQYDNAPLTAVARDLSRALGKPVRASTSVADMRYTGTISTTGSERAMVDAAAALLGVRMRETDNHWEMTPEHAPPS